jgi:HAD superfamily hydrolase (TIGR01509 family)
VTDKLVIFDCDGVLVDSEVISIKLLMLHVATRGVCLSEQQAYRAFLGKPVADAHTYVNEMFGFEIEQVDLVDFQVDILREFRAKLQPVTGLKDALEGIPTAKCVASSSNMARISGSLRLTGLSDFFGQNLFSTDQVKRGKPHPDVFLHAASVMKAEPEQAVVVEDSPAGLMAARAAGMKTIAFVGASHAEPANLREHLAHQKPDIMIDDMAQLPSSISKLLNE